MSVNLNPQLRWDELGSSGVQNVVSCDDFFVDEFLNFSQEDVFEGRANGEDKEDKGLACVSVSTQEPECENLNESCSVTDGFECLSTTRLSALIDDLADLEWLFNFVDDSFSEHSAPCPAGIWTGKLTLKELERKTKDFTPPTPQPCFKTPVPAKARSKRPRIRRRVSVVGSSSLMESSSRSTMSPSSSSLPSSSLLLYNTMVSLPKEIVYQYAEPLATKPKIKSAVNENGGSGTTQTTWRCNHCSVQKTPLCRAGPIGAKTLCNACGIRYKSGRLLPEYRPACSPTFQLNYTQITTFKCCKCGGRRRIQDFQSRVSTAIDDHFCVLLQPHGYFS